MKNIPSKLLLLCLGLGISFGVQAAAQKYTYDTHPFQEGPRIFIKNSTKKPLSYYFQYEPTLTPPKYAKFAEIKGSVGPQETFDLKTTLHEVGLREVGVLSIGDEFAKLDELKKSLKHSQNLVFNYRGPNDIKVDPTYSRLLISPKDPPPTANLTGNLYIKNNYTSPITVKYLPMNQYEDKQTKLVSPAATRIAALKDLHRAIAIDPKTYFFWTDILTGINPPTRDSDDLLIEISTTYPLGLGEWRVEGSWVSSQTREPIKPPTQPSKPLSGKAKKLSDQIILIKQIDEAIKEAGGTEKLDKEKFIPQNLEKLTNLFGSNLKEGYKALSLTWHPDKIPAQMKEFKEIWPNLNEQDIDQKAKEVFQTIGFLFEFQKK